MRPKQEQWSETHPALGSGNLPGGSVAEWDWVSIAYDEIRHLSRLL